MNASTSPHATGSGTPRPARTRTALVLSGGVLLALCVFSAFVFDRAPFLLYFSGLVLLFFLLFCASGRGSLRAFWVNVGAVCFALLIAEGYFWLRAADPDDGGDAKSELRLIGRPAYVEDPKLGWVLPPDTTWTEIKVHGADVIYEAAYTTDAHGLRIAPGNAEVGGACVLFFGGSYTFGTGVNDGETMPAQVAAISGTRVINFGVPGYGPHQMLAALETGFVDKAVDCTPSHAIYQGLNDHMARAAGKRRYGITGPRYVLLDDGSVRADGQFNDVRAEPSALQTFLGRSFVYQAVAGSVTDITAPDVARYMALIDASRNVLQQRYPGIDVHVLQWGTRYHDPLDRLPSMGIGLSYVDEVLENFDSKHGRQMISPYEPHPNPETHRQIAEFLVRTLLAGGTAPSGQDSRRD
jgi:hypothetical protein